MSFATRMKAARTDSGLSLVEAAYEIRTWLPEADWVGYDVIRRLEAGTTPEAKADPALMAALARVYDVPVADLSEVAAKGLAKLRHLVSAAGMKGSGRSVRNRCFVSAA